MEPSVEFYNKVCERFLEITELNMVPFAGGDPDNSPFDPGTLFYGKENGILTQLTEYVSDLFTDTDADAEKQVNIDNLLSLYSIAKQRYLVNTLLPYIATFQRSEIFKELYEFGPGKWREFVNLTNDTYPGDGWPNGLMVTANNGAENPFYLVWFASLQIKNDSGNVIFSNPPNPPMDFPNSITKVVAKVQDQVISDAKKKPVLKPGWLNFDVDAGGCFLSGLVNYWESGRGAEQPTNCSAGTLGDKLLGTYPQGKGKGKKRKGGLLEKGPFISHCRVFANLFKLMYLMAINRMKNMRETIHDREWKRVTVLPAATANPRLVDDAGAGVIVNDLSNRANYFKHCDLPLTFLDKPKLEHINKPQSRTPGGQLGSTETCHNLDQDGNVYGPSHPCRNKQEEKDYFCKKNDRDFDDHKICLKSIESIRTQNDLGGIWVDDPTIHQEPGINSYEYSKGMYGHCEDWRRKGEEFRRLDGAGLTLEQRTARRDMGWVAEDAKNKPTPAAGQPVGMEAGSQFWFDRRKRNDNLEDGSARPQISQNITHHARPPNDGRGVRPDFVPYSNLI